MHNKIYGAYNTKAWKYMVLVEAQTLTPRSKSHILSHQMTILLERNEQGYPEI